MTNKLKVATAGHDKPPPRGELSFDMLTASTEREIITAEYHRPISGLPQISESAILGHARHLSETIGYRTVGTREHALGDAWMVDQAAALKTQCDALVAASPHRALECEVWRQEGNGSHRFDMMGRRLYKTYVGLSNVVVRLSNGTSEGKEHAVLINSHVDSTLPSPGSGI
ncbi:hypothetical protein HWV62_5371 [Athelia sp. TMB]|nr:hypothetical protein HWV62_5371 [Athelia sp. TMB]